MDCAPIRKLPGDTPRISAVVASGLVNIWKQSNIMRLLCSEVSWSDWTTINREDNSIRSDFHSSRFFLAKVRLKHLFKWFSGPQTPRAAKSTDVWEPPWANLRRTPSFLSECEVGACVSQLITGKTWVRLLRRADFLRYYRGRDEIRYASKSKIRIKIFVEIADQ